MSAHVVIQPWNGRAEGAVPWALLVAGSMASLATNVAVPSQL